MDLEAKRARAIEKVNKIKKFHNHLRAYLVVNIGILFLRFTGLGFVINGIENTSDSNFLRWIDWNVFGLPVVWGIFLVFHAARTFNWIPFLDDKWEERKIKEFMEQDDKKNS